MVKVFWAKQALKMLKKVDIRGQKAILNATKKLSSFPSLSNIKTLEKS